MASDLRMEPPYTQGLPAAASGDIPASWPGPRSRPVTARHHGQMVPEPVTIRLAPTMQKVLVVWLALLAACAVAIGAAAAAHGSLAGALVAFAFVGMLATVGRRWASLAVTVGHNELVVRQFLGSRTVQRSDIASFRVGGRRIETPGIAVRAVLRDGSSFVLAATGFYFRSEQDVQTFCIALEDWRRRSS